MSLATSRDMDVGLWRHRQGALATFLATSRDMDLTPWRCCRRPAKCLWRRRATWVWASGDIAKVLWRHLWRRRATWIWGSGDIARRLWRSRDPAQGAQKAAGDVARHVFGALATFRNISGEVATLAKGAQKVAGDVARHAFEALAILGDMVHGP